MAQRLNGREEERKGVTRGSNPSYYMKIGDKNLGNDEFTEV